MEGACNWQRKDNETDNEDHPEVPHYVGSCGQRCEHRWRAMAQGRAKITRCGRPCSKSRYHEKRCQGRHVCSVCEDVIQTFIEWQAAGYTREQQQAAEDAEAQYEGEERLAVQEYRKIVGRQEGKGSRSDGVEDEQWQAREAAARGRLGDVDRKGQARFHLSPPKLSEEEREQARKLLDARNQERRCVHPSPHDKLWAEKAAGQKG